jgi:hypothetical protein
MGAKIPKTVSEAEAVREAVYAKVNEKPQDLAVKLRTAKPADVPGILDEYGVQLAAANATKNSGATTVADSRLMAAWAVAKSGVMDDLIWSLTDKVAEINRLSTQVPASVAADMNSSTDPEALASVAKLKVLLSEVAKVAKFVAVTVRDGAAEQHVQIGGVEFDLIRLTNIEPEFEGFYAKQRVLKNGNEYTPVLSAAGVVALAGVGITLDVHGLQDQISRAVKLYQSRQGFEVKDGAVKRISEEQQAYERAKARTWI